MSQATSGPSLLAVFHPFNLSLHVFFPDKFTMKRHLTVQVRECVCLFECIYFSVLHVDNKLYLRLRLDHNLILSLKSRLCYADHLDFTHLSRCINDHMSLALVTRWLMVLELVREGSGRKKDKAFTSKGDLTNSTLRVRF